MMYKIVLSLIFSITAQAMELMEAACDGEIQRIQEAINAGADINAQDDNGQSALIWAAYYGHKNIVKLLLKHSAHVNVQDTYGRTALIYAVARGCKDIIELLLKHGADVTLRSESIETALDWAREMHGISVISPEEKAKYRGIGKMLLETYIEQKKRPLKEAILESKKTEIRQLAAQYSGVPAQEIIKHIIL